MGETDLSQESAVTVTCRLPLFQTYMYSKCPIISMSKPSPQLDLLFSHLILAMLWFKFTLVQIVLEPV